MTEPLSEGLCRRVERARADYRMDRARALAKLHAATGRPAIHVEELHGVLMTDWAPFPRVFCLNHDNAEQLDAVLAWYARRELSPHFEMLPLHGNRALFERLASVGFAPTYCISVVHGHSDEISTTDVGEVAIRHSPDDELPRWADLYIDAHGWDVGTDERDEWIGDLTVQYGLPTFRRYVADVDGEPVAVAATYETPHGIAHLSNAAVLPAHRGAGLHAALIRRRIADAAGTEFTEFSADAAPYSQSQRNLERRGLRLIYQKQHWVRPAPRETA